MGRLFIFVRVVHVVTAAIWLGSAFFAGWFLMPAMRDAGPEAGKLMAAVQKRGWIAIAPIIATITVLSGFYLYRPYMGDSGHAAALFGYGGVVGIIALVIGAVVVSRSVSKATSLMAKVAAMPEGPGRAAAVTTATQLRARALLFTRIMSLLLILAAAMMTMAHYV